MRFHKKFTRTVGGGGTALGSDSPPTGRPKKKTDNQMQSSFVIVHEWPVHRIAVGYVGPGGAPNLPARLYLYDELSQNWFLVSADVTLVAGRLTYFDVLAVQPPPVRSDSSAGNSGSLEVALVVDSVGGEPSGDYVFSMAPDLTAVATSEAASLGTVDQGAAGTDPWLVRDMNKLVPLVYDYIALTYVAPGDDRISTVVFRTGGAAGTIVATLTLTYVGSTDQIATVTRT